MPSSTLSKNIKISEAAIISAIIILMTFVPYLGYINYGGISITLIHIPVIIGSCALGAGGGTIFGSVWGVSCLLKALFAPPSPLEGIIFKNPLVSVLPRILAGLIAGMTYSLLSKTSMNKIISSALSALLSCLTNTIFVMGGIYLIYGEKYGTELGISSVNFGGLTNYILAAFTLNAIIEIVSAIIITVPVVKALKRIK